MNGTSARRFYAGVFAISGLLMGLQIVQSRIFSVTTWYHISFLVVSVAMFGLTLGAIRVYRGKESEQRSHYAREMTSACFRFGIGIVVGLVGQLSLPILSDDPMVTIFALPVVAGMTLPAYYYAGVTLSLAITRAPFPAARTYGFDLLGAACGCLLALGLMETVDAPSAALALALAAVATAGWFGKREERLRYIAALAIGLALAVNVLSPQPVIKPYWVKQYHYPEKSIAYDKWNSISRVMVLEERKDVPPYLWGPSDRLPEDLKTSWYELIIDGNAGAVVNKWDGKDKGNALRSLDYDVATVAYAMPGIKTTGIIGLGGGRDVLSSLHAGATSVTALDVNSTQVSMLTSVDKFRNYENLANRSDVRLIHAEARSWLASNPDKFDLIQMSMVDTWAATGAGAFALTENGLYTVEAWKTFLSRLNPSGVMTVSRWYLADAQSEGERVLALAMGALLDSGAKDPKQHIFVAVGYRVITLVLGRDPLTTAQLDALEKRCKQMDFKVLVSPRKDVAGSEFAEILNAQSRDALDALAAKSRFDISPPTDWRPFFFNQIRLGDPALVFEAISKKGLSGYVGFAQAIANLYVVIAFSALMVVFAIIYPLRSELKAKNSFITAGTVWFLLIGLGFMFVEMALMQRMSVYLGHPAYGLAIVLFSLVLSTGLGSMLCDAMPLETTSSRVTWALCTTATIVCSVFFIDGAMKVFADASLFVRAFLCVSVTAPVGCLMGFGFPTGIEMAKQAHSRSTAWFWGINGAAGVMGSSLAIAINIAAGIDTAMFCAALCYALLAVPALTYEAKN